MKRAPAVAAAVLFALAVPLAGSAAGKAAGSLGPCGATIAGRDAARATTPGHAIRIDARRDVLVTVTSRQPVTGYRIDLELFGIRWSAAHGKASGTRWTAKVHAANYAKYGVGVYRIVIGSTGTGACSTTAYVRLEGRSPLTTIMGIAAIIIGLLSLYALGRALIAAARRGRSGGRVVNGAIDGLCAAVAALILLQSFAIVYPTLVVTAVGLGIGVAGCALLTFLFGTGARTRRS